MARERLYTLAEIRRAARDRYHARSTTMGDERWVERVAEWLHNTISAINGVPGSWSDADTYPVSNSGELFRDSYRGLARELRALASQESREPEFWIPVEDLRWIR